MPTAAPTMPTSLIGASKQRLLPYFACSPCVQRNTPPKEAHILAEHDDIVVAAHHDIHRVADGLDHRLRGMIRLPPAGAGGADAAASAA